MEETRARYEILLPIKALSIVIYHLSLFISRLSFRHVSAAAFFLYLLSFSPARAQEGLNIAILGDSNTWLGGDSCNQSKGWTKWFKEDIQPSTCVSYARSGATWTSTSSTKRNLEENIGVLGDDNVIYNQVERLKEAHDKGMQLVPDIIIIAAGTNDGWFKAKRPRVLEGAGEESIRHNCQLLKDYFPHARIVLLTPIQKADTAINKDIMAVTEIIKKVAKEMNLSVIDLYNKGCVKCKREMRKRTFTYDGTHTNAQGAKRNGSLVAKELKTIIKNDIAK